MKKQNKHRAYITFPSELAKKISKDNHVIYHFIAVASNELGLNGITFSKLSIRSLKRGKVRIYIEGIRQEQEV